MPEISRPPNTLRDSHLVKYKLINLPQQVLITKLRSANTLETEQYRKATKALLVLIPLLGITNLLVLCGPGGESWFADAFDYTRALMLSTQVNK